MQYFKAGFKILLYYLLAADIWTKEVIKPQHYLCSLQLNVSLPINMSLLPIV